MDDSTRSTLRHGLNDHQHALRLFCDALVLPMYQQERVEFLAEVIGTCDTMINEIGPLCAEIPDQATDQPHDQRAAQFQWKMDAGDYFVS
jgi:hypothetical protein